MKITKELVVKLEDKNITKREYDKIVNQINAKVDGIWRRLCKISNRDLDWWAFDNDVSLGDGNGSTGGEFDPVDHKKWIGIIGDVRRFYNKYYDYDDGFPTYFLWNDNWEKIVIENLAESQTRQRLEKQSTKEKRENLKLRKTQFKEIIKNKLSKEELKYITFK